MLTFRALALFTLFHLAGAQLNFLQTIRESIQETVDNLQEAVDNIIESVENATGIDIPGNNGGIADTFCDAVIDIVESIEEIPLEDDQITCDCELDSGVVGVGCGVNETFCLTDDVCGTIEVEGSYYIYGSETEEFISQVCFVLEDSDTSNYKDFCAKLNHTGLPEDLSDPDPEVLIAQLAVYDCELWAVGDDDQKELCNSCTVCPGGQSFKYNCSNVDLDNSDEEFIIPSTDECLGLYNEVDMDITTKQRGRNMKMRVPVPRL
jgi:hypothetical protein